jgi:hypothetical protein
MDSNRYGEQGHPPFRNRRLFSVNAQWYFDTREGKQFGPYQDKNEAEKALALFIAKSIYGLNVDRTDNHNLHHGAQDGIECLVEELLEYFQYYDNYRHAAALAWANLRIQELIENKNNISNSKERIEALKYVKDHDE